MCISSGSSARWNLFDAEDDLSRRVAPVRGGWVVGTVFRFKDSEILEGLMPADLTQTTPEAISLVNFLQTSVRTRSGFLCRERRWSH